MWGAIADSKGRKPVLVISSILMAVFSIGFGFSVSFPMAVIMRFMTGFTNGERELDLNVLYNRPNAESINVTYNIYFISQATWNIFKVFYTDMKICQYGKKNIIKIYIYY